MTKKILLFGCLIAVGACSIFKGTKTPDPVIYDFSQNITIDGLHGDLAVLSHDSLQGRETGTEGLQQAARYLEKRYRQIGLTPVGDNGSYFQHFDLSQPIINSYTYTVYTADGETVVDKSELASGSENPNFVTLFGGDDPLKGQVVFAGYGMYDEATGINQFPENVVGKWLMLFFDRSITNMNYLQSNLGASGALGAIMVMNPGDVENYNEQAVSLKERVGSPGRMALSYLQEEDSDSQAPAFNRINPILAATILGVDSPAALVDLESSIKEEPAAFKAQELDYIVEHTPDVEQNTVSSQNVVAFLEGSDPELKDEVVVLSAHYDHVGVGRPDSTGDSIYNGADDDGSGTVATLQTAQAMAAAQKAGVGPRRSVLFLHVAGEEKGLLGSRYYSDHPIFSIENTVADINIDMIGRVDKEHVEDSSYVYIIGGEIISSGLDSLTQVANAMGDNITLSKRYNDLEDPNQFYRRSDHWNFGRLGVPFVFFFNGVHPDYHQPGDEISKITFKPYLQRTHLVYNLTAILANSDERPVVDNQEFINKTQVQPR